MEKITKREMYESLISVVATGEMKYDKDAYIDFCQKEIESLEKKAEKAKTNAAKKKAEGDKLADAVYAALSAEEFETKETITDRVGDEDATVAKVQYRLTALVKEGKAEKSEIEIAGSEGQKKRKVMAYRRLA